MPSSITYKSGFTSTVTWNGVTYPQAEHIKLPTDTAAMTKVMHLAGIDKDFDGQQDFGNVSFTIPEDGTASLQDGINHSGTVACTRISKTISFVGFCTGDERAELRRGQPMKRVVTIELTANPTWA
jgi:hypothetical protein